MTIDQTQQFGARGGYEVISKDDYLDELETQAKRAVERADLEEMQKDDWHIQATEQLIGSHDWFIYRNPFLWLSVIMNGQRDVEAIRDPDHYLQAGDTLIDKLQIMAQLQMEVDMYDAMDAAKNESGIQTTIEQA